MTKKDIETQIRLLFEMWVQKKQEEPLNKVRYAGPVLGVTEYDNVLTAIFSDWWSGGKFTVEAEDKLAKISDRNHGLLTNSGSSANLVLMSAARELYFQDCDKILTLSCGFPTTVNPIMTSRMIPVFVDISLEDLSLDLNLFEDALKNDSKIKGVFIAHTLGFKGKIDEILDIARRYNVLVFFDNCDSYGTKYKGRPIQSYGKAATYSFYVAHHLTMGEGGGITTNDQDLHLTMRGFRNWGRYCASTNCCVRSVKPEMFCPTSKLTRHCDLPEDYIVNYQYEWLGFNLKPLELQSAMLLAQIDKMSEFDSIRKKNYNNLLSYFKSNCKFKFTTWDIDDEVSPFAFPLLLPKDSPFTRKHLVDFLARKGIETRLLFGGNLMKHPAYTKKSAWWESYGSHTNADLISKSFVMLGVSQVNNDTHISKVITEVENFCNTW